MNEYWIGIDLGGTNVKAVAADRNGAVLDRRTCPTEDRPGRPWAEAARNLLRELEETRSGRAIAVGVSAPGLARPDGRAIAFMPGRLEGLENFEWGLGLGRADYVPVLNDAHAALLGEAWCGAAQGVSDAILLTLGTGVGGAILSGGKLLTGRIGRAGHLGHVSLDPRGALDIMRTPGSLEDAIGECTLQQRTEGRYANTEALVRAASAGDVEAQRIWRQSVRALAASLIGFFNTLDPEVAVIGGGIAKAGPLLFGPLGEELDEIEWRPAGHRVRIEAAKLGEWAGAIGAARRALMEKSL